MTQILILVQNGKLGIQTDGTPREALDVLLQACRTVAKELMDKPERPKIIPAKQIPVLP